MSWILFFGVPAIVILGFALLLILINPGYPDDEEKIRAGGLCESILDEHYSKVAASGDKLKYLSKKRRQQIRGVDYYKCEECGEVGPPWNIDLWTEDLDTVDEDVIPGGCRCGGTVVLIDD